MGTLSGGGIVSGVAGHGAGLFADVVQARRGGVRLDTLFIDEGFGTLDEKETALLQELAGGQRLVGVISHVAALWGLHRKENRGTRRTRRAPCMSYAGIRGLSGRKQVWYNRKKDGFAKARSKQKGCAVPMKKR